MSAPTRDDLVDFIYHEARLLDEKRLEEWYELYTDDAYYWIPVTPGQPDGVNHVSLLYEDKLLLNLRIVRLRDPCASSRDHRGTGHIRYGSGHPGSYTTYATNPPPAGRSAVKWRTPLHRRNRWQPDRFVST